MQRNVRRQTQSTLRGIEDESARCTRVMRPPRRSKRHSAEAAVRAAERWRTIVSGRVTSGNCSDAGAPPPPRVLRPIKVPACYRKSSTPVKKKNSQNDSSLRPQHAPRFSFFFRFLQKIEKGVRGVGGVPLRGGDPSDTLQELLYLLSGGGLGSVTLSRRSRLVNASRSGTSCNVCSGAVWREAPCFRHACAAGPRTSGGNAATGATKATTSTS